MIIQTTKKQKIVKYYIILKEDNSEVDEDNEGWPDTLWSRLDLIVRVGSYSKSWIFEKL